MFHFSTDRLAGLDAMTLKITTTPQKVPTLISNNSLRHDTYTPVRKLRKQKPRREPRLPFVDKTASNNIAPRLSHPTCSVFLYTHSIAGEVNLLPPNGSSSPRVSCSLDLPSFCPLPPLPSASTLQLPLFLKFSVQSLPSLADPPPHRSIPSFQPSVLFCVPSPVASSRYAAIRKTRNNKVVEGPQWIPAFHHPNSPYVPWSSSVRRRILPPPSPHPPSPDCLCSPHIRSGAVAPEPWASSTFSQAPKKSRKELLSRPWKSFKNSIKKGVKTVVSCLGKSTKSTRMPCISQDMLRTRDYTDTVVPNMACNVQPTRMYSRGSRDSLASFVSSDSMTLAAWLAERRASTSYLTENTPGEMSVEEYELIGSWLDLCRCDGGWVCGVQDCDMHTSSGSPYVAGEYADGLRTAMPIDGVGVLSVLDPSPTPPGQPSPPAPFSALPHFHSFPRLPCQSLDIHSAQGAKPTTLENAE